MKTLSLLQDFPRVYIPTDVEVEDFLYRGDPDIQIEIAEEQMIPKDLTFPEFFRRYQIKHFERFGCTLKLKIQTPKYLKN